MIIPLAGWVGHDDLHAAIGGVVGSPALLAVAVADAVSVSFVKLDKQKNKSLQLLPVVPAALLTAV